MTATSILTAAGSGGLVGFTLGLIGGGSILATPLLLYVVGVAGPHVVIGTGALAVSVNAYTNLASHARKGHVWWRCSIVFALVGTVGAMLGSSLGLLADGKNLLFLFGLVLVADLFGTLIALGALLVMHRETRPIVQLADAADRFDLSGQRLPLPSTRNRAPEVGTLITAFDRLQRRLDSTMRSRMAMLGGISHDVRTFATRLRLRVDRIPDVAERERATSDIDDMIGLLDDALLASRAGADELQQELVDIHALAAAEASDRLAQGAAVTYRPERVDTELLVLGDRVALRRIIANATDNALKYGKAAHLTTAIEDGCIVIAVEDEGPGIPPGQQALMFEPFTRLESSRNRGTGGAGLGLAIIRTLVEAHAGSVDIGPAPSGGARLTIHLPHFT